jgi:two-component system sensor histidine kinase UhpB
VLLTPFVYLIFEFLRQQHRYHLLGLDTNNPPLRTSLIIWCSLFFIIGIGTQMVLSPEIERLLLIVVFLPNVVMAWKFGWQGGVLSGLLGSMMITIARQVGVGFSNLVELEIFLATQALLGIGLGIAISRQQHLAQNLHHYRQRLEAELAARRALAEKLIHTEEDTRKSLARELHDEIGQNITAIQIQSQLVKRARDPAQTRPPPARLTISPGVFTTPPASCCASCALRPSMSCRLKRRCTICSMSLPLPSAVSAAALTTGSPPRRRAKRCASPSIGCCRSCLITSVSTPTPARSPLPCFSRGAAAPGGEGQRHRHQPDKMAGFGIQGMRERVSALGGELTLESQRGTRVIVNLPTNLQQTAG